MKRLMAVCGLGLFVLAGCGGGGGGGGIILPILYLFSSNRDDPANYEIYTSTESGAQLARLTINAATDEEPSGRGNLIVFLRRNHPIWELRKMAANGTGDTRMFPALTNTSFGTPELSPDGTKVATFATGTDGVNGLYSVTIANEQLSLIAPAFWGGYAWNDASDRIVFYDINDDTFKIRLTNGTQVDSFQASTNAAQPRGLTWRGNKIVYGGQQAGVDGLFAFDVVTRTDTRLTTQQDQAPSFSPDGTYLTYFRANRWYRRAASGAPPETVMPFFDGPVGGLTFLYP